MRALIGSNGTVGQSLLDTMQFDAVFNSHNLHCIQQHKWDTIVVAAPSGNRLAINRGNTDDLGDCHAIVTALAHTCVRKTVLIGSVDAVTAPDTHYGHARLWLEENLPQCEERCVFRLATLIGSRIKKNLIFNLKHNLFLDTVDPDAELQWSILSDLHRHILTQYSQSHTVRNLVSVPIKNSLIIDSFRPDLAVTVPLPSSIRYDLKPYTYTQQDILLAVGEYMA